MYAAFGMMIQPQLLLVWRVPRPGRQLKKKKKGRGDFFFFEVIAFSLIIRPLVAGLALLASARHRALTSTQCRGQGNSAATCREKDQPAFN